MVFSAIFLTKGRCFKSKFRFKICSHSGKIHLLFTRIFPRTPTHTHTWVLFHSPNPKIYPFLFFLLGRRHQHHQHTRARRFSLPLPAATTRGKSRVIKLTLVSGASARFSLCSLCYSFLVEGRGTLFPSLSRTRNFWS